MAFLRSVTRCNQSLAVSRNFSSSMRSGVRRKSNVLTSLNNATFSRAELLACKKYYFDLKHDINTSSQDNGQKPSMSTLATTKAPFPSAASTSNDSNQPQRDPLDVSFNDPIAAFKSKTTLELIRAYVVYLLCSSEKIVEHNDKVKI